MARQNPPRQAYSVSALVRTLKNAVETAFPAVWLEGELTNFGRPSSGHWYFSLKDEHAQMQCVMFRGNNARVQPVPQEGDQVLVRGRISVYQNRGQLQLICDHLEAAGLGALQREFERLKHKLEAEGLFDPAWRRPLPPRPHRIGVITSDTGAALQDILDTLKRRWPLAQVCLWPTPVQGPQAAPRIVAALAGLPQKAQVDCIILARGGGSLEDLWAFNEETVARAVRACTVPVITGIGHETDTTIADFAADLRAPTPTAAAELAVPDRFELLAQVKQLRNAVVHYARVRHQGLSEDTSNLGRRLALQHPQRALEDGAQTLDARTQRLQRSLALQLRNLQRTLLSDTKRLERQHPRRTLEQRRQRLARARRQLLLTQQRSIALRRQRLTLSATALAPTAFRARVRSTQQQLGTARQRLVVAGNRLLERHCADLDHAGRVLHSLGPKAVLKRGFAWVSNTAGEPLRTVQQVAIGEAIRVQLHHGKLSATVNDKSENAEP